jgi:preprotein translocase subunit SecG
MNLRRSAGRQIANRKEVMEILLVVLHVLAAIGVCGLVLLQHGKGADMGAAFGSGSSGSLFGASGSANFLSRATAALATVFFVTSLGLTYLATRVGKDQGVILQQPSGQAPAAVPAPGTAPAPAAPETDSSRTKEIPK